MSSEFDAGIALVGASESMPWSYWIIRNLETYGYTGPIWPVNPRQQQVHGKPAFPSIDALPGAPSIGVCLLRPDLAESAINEFLALGVRTIVLISNGFRETGDPAAAAREQRIAVACRTAGARLIGPNCVGFGAFGAGTVPIAEPFVNGVRVGTVSIASQSGALVAAVVGAVHSGGSGIDRVYSLGNGAAFDVVDATWEFARSSSSTVLVAVLEGLARAEDFAAAVRAAHGSGKHVVVLRLGRSDRSAQVAKSHTGSVVGANRLMSAWLRDIGVVEADTIDELGVLAVLLDQPPPPIGSGVFVLSASGGAAGYAADLAVANGVELAELAPATSEALRNAMPVGAYIGNPLDVVGATPERKQVIRELIYRDPNVGLVLEPYALPWPDESPDREWYREGLAGLARVSRELGTPTLTASVFSEPMTEWVDQLRFGGGLIADTGLTAAMRALGKIFQARPDEHSPSNASDPASTDASVVAEAEARELLSQEGFPVVRGGVADSPYAAGELAVELGGPVAIKAAVSGLAHKARIGGVALDVLGRDRTEAVSAEMIGSVRAAGVVGEVRLMVQEMVRGPEILIGLIRDVVVGPTCTVGFGGWAAELAPPLDSFTLNDPTTFTADAMVERITSWGLVKALGGKTVADLATLLAELCESFSTGKFAGYETLEINPVVMTAGGPCIVDALLVQISHA